MALSPRFTEALTLAALLHRDQTRKGPGKTPYVSHLLLVAGIVLEYGGTEDEAIAALLHDAVEDQGGPKTRGLIRRLFGGPVTAIVDGCTDSDSFPKPPWRLRKETFVASLPEADASVLLVVLADKLSNVRSTCRDLRESGQQIWSRFQGGRDGTLWYYRAISKAIVPADERVRRLSEEYLRAVGELERLAGGAVR